MVSKAPTKTVLPPNGMKNRGNTCFFNASMQCLISIPSIVKYFQETAFDSKKQPFSKEMQNFIFKYRNYKVVDPSEFIKSIQGSIKMFDGKQQDAHSFLEYLLNHFSNEANSQDKNFFKENFGIHSEDTIKCHKCSFTSKVEAFSSMQYLIVTKSIQESINAYVNNSEIIDSSCPWKCEKCESKSDSSISHCLKSTSNYVIFYLNRFQSLTQKNHRSIYIDETISICDELYDNIGIVCHSGGLSSGHYFSYAKRDFWYEFNDSVVQKTDLPTDTDTVYVLFYSRKLN